MPEIINDHKDQRIQKFLGLKGINKDTLIIAEGFKIVEKLNNTLGVEEILTSKSIYEEHSEYFKNFTAKVYLADPKFISEHVGYKFHHGVFATTSHPGFCDIDEISGETLILNNLDNAENVGAIIRSATGLGFNNILIDERTVSPFLKRSIRVSMGNVFFAKVFRVSNLVETIPKLKENGFKIYSAANEEGSLDYKRDVNLDSKNFGIIIGNEGHGIDEEVKKVSTGTIKIPVLDTVEHLNAAAAGAILMSRFSPY